MEQEKKLYELPPSQQYAKVAAIVGTDELFFVKFFAGFVAGLIIGALIGKVF